MTSRDPDWERGVAEFAAGRFYEAHEHWERLWLRLPKRVVSRRAVQAAVQLAAAAHKFRLGVPRGTEKLLAKAECNLQALETSAPRHELLAGIAAVRRALTATPDAAVEDAFRRLPVGNVRACLGDNPTGWFAA